MTSGDAVRVALLGAGERGQLMFCLFSKKHPRLFNYVSVEDQNYDLR
jgi:hypothetical protein